jgi:hypothetical protein
VAQPFQAKAPKYNFSMEFDQPPFTALLLLGRCEGKAEEGMFFDRQLPLKKKFGNQLTSVPVTPISR